MLRLWSTSNIFSSLFIFSILYLGIPLLLFYLMIYVKLHHTAYSHKNSINIPTLRTPDARWPAEPLPQTMPHDPPLPHKFPSRRPTPLETILPTQKSIISPRATPLHPRQANHQQKIQPHSPESIKSPQRIVKTRNLATQHRQHVIFQR